MDDINDITSDRVMDFVTTLTDKVRSEAYGNKSYGFNYSPIRFFKTMKTYFSSQMYGIRIQDRLIHDTNMLGIPSHLDKGDATANKKNIEIKVGFVKNNFVNFLQIRLYQDCEYYLLRAIDKSENYKQHTFIIPKSDMVELMNNAGKTHGTKDRNKNNVEIELSYGVTKGTSKWENLMEKYHVDDVKKYLDNL